MNAVQAAYAALYGVTASELAAGMADVGDALSDQLRRLSLDPDAEAAAAVANNLDGARRAVLRLREALSKEQGVPDGVSA